jgi:hypothetical protein
MTTKPKTRPRGKSTGRIRVGRIRKCVCVTIAPEAAAVLERLRLTENGVLTASAVVETLLLAVAAKGNP